MYVDVSFIYVFNSPYRSISLSFSIWKTSFKLLFFCKYKAFLLGVTIKCKLNCIKMCSLVKNYHVR